MRGKGAMAIGKRLKKAREGVDREKLYPLGEAIKMVKERAKSKFDETIEIAINLGVDLAATANFRDLFGRHQHLLEQFLEPALLRLLADRFRNFLFKVRIGVNDIPALIHRLSFEACHQRMPSKKVTT